ncbi:MAG: hypothetical protein Q3962_05350 [Corynebacterium sp.]|nr:hypothetical protein [Corynebacterium sp.]
MNDNSSRPVDDLDDVDVPTYGGDPNPTQRAYERAGRVAPTVITPGGSRSQLSLLRKQMSQRLLLQSRSQWSLMSR